MTGPDYRDPRLTEQRNPRTERIDVASALEIVDLLNAEDATVAGAVHAVRGDVARAIDLVVAAFGRGGRLIYVGAGTSGRRCLARRRSVRRPDCFLARIRRGCSSTHATSSFSRRSGPKRSPGRRA